MKLLAKPLRDLPKGLPSLNDRIEHLRCVLGYTPQAFATKISAYPETFKRVALHKAVPTMQMANNILAVFPVSKEWLFMGTGDIFTQDDLTNFYYKPGGNRDYDYIDKEVNERFREVRNDKEMSQAVFAASLGATKTMVSSIEIFRQGIPVPLMKNFLKKYNVSSEWFLWGVGNKYKVKKGS